MFIHHRKGFSSISVLSTQYGCLSRKGWQSLIAAIALGATILLLIPGTQHEGTKKSNSVSKRAGPSLCVNNYDDLPELWKYDGLNISFFDSGLPWSQSEQDLAIEAAETGLKELVDFFDHNLTEIRIKNLNVDAVNCLIDQAYGSQDRPVAHNKALKKAAEVLLLNGEKFVSNLKEQEKFRGCNRQYSKLKFLGFAQYLSNNLPKDKKLIKFTKNLAKRVNEMFEDCKTLDNVLNVGDLSTMFAKPNDDSDALFEWILNSIALVDVMTVPELKMPKGSEDFVANVWNHLAYVDWPNARDHPKHYKHGNTRDMAWVVTHLAYIPTGYGRHQQYVDDAPYLYDYIRENFYYALEFGMLDLICEFIDLVRQYGCDESNDYQLRHGTRYVLSLYEAAGKSWMNHKAVRKDGKEVSDYDKIHKPWTGISGVEPRMFEPIVPGSYGYAYQKAMAKAAKNKENRIKHKDTTAYSWLGD